MSGGTIRAVGPGAGAEGRRADSEMLSVSCSEKFMVKLNKNGGPKNPEKVDRLCALFTVMQLPVLVVNEHRCGGVVVW